VIDMENTPLGGLLDLDAIEARATAASPGPWRTHDTHLDIGGHTATVLRNEASATELVAWLPTRSNEPWNNTRNCWADAEFIASSRADVSALVAELRRTRAALAELKWAEILTEQGCAERRHTEWYADAENLRACSAESPPLTVTDAERAAWLAEVDPPRRWELPAELRGDGPCGDCGTVDNVVWFTESVFWNRVMRRPDVAAEAAGGIVCIPCFVVRTDAAGLYPTGWRLLPDFHWETRDEREARKARPAAPEQPAAPATLAVERPAGSAATWGQAEAPGGGGGRG
jgi:hypothetical protein